MKVFTLQQLNEKSKEKPFGYKAAVLKLAKPVEQKDTYILEDKDFDILAAKYGNRYNIIWKIKGFFKSMWANLLVAIKQKKFKAPKKIQKERYSICKSCDQFNSTTKTCNSCGCFLPLKSSMSVGTCPLNKWPR